MRRRAALLPALCVLVLGVPATAGATTTLPGLRSPSGNIRCLLLPGGSRLLCTIDHANYAALLQARCLAPGGAGVDWHGFTIGAAGEGLLNCSGGIEYSPATRPSYVTLAYGRTRRLGPFTCTSTRTGVTCRNGRGGHGLFLSRESWRAW